MTDSKIKFHSQLGTGDELEAGDRDLQPQPGVPEPLPEPEVDQWEPLERFHNSSFGSENGSAGGPGRPRGGSGLGLTTRRPTIFAIGENWDWDESQRKLSRRPSTSSNSSLESECGETWKSRARRRNSVIPVSMGLQPWVKQLELLATTATGTTAAEDPNTIRQPQPHGKKRRKYEDIKSLVKAGKLSEAKGAVRDGDWDWTEDLRSRLWPFLESVHESGSAQCGTDYWEIVRELFGHARNEVPEAGRINIPSQCQSPGGAGIYYQLDARGVQMCHRVVAVVIYGFPDITYCPWLVPVASLFLHYLEVRTLLPWRRRWRLRWSCRHGAGACAGSADIFKIHHFLRFLQEEKVHSALCNLLSAKHKVFLTQTKLQFEVCSQVAGALTKKFSKSTYSNLVRQLGPGERIEGVFESWSWWIWRDLPLQHVVRIMDCFLMEGIKVLYRVTIGLLNHFVKNHHGSVPPGENLSGAISRMCRENLQLSPIRLLKSAFSIRNFRSAEIRNVTNKLMFTIKSENKSPRRNKSTDSMPNSKSQADICTTSKTLNNAKESDEIDSTINLVGNVSSLTCTRDQLLKVWQWLPLRITMYQPLRIYTTDEDGTSLTHFFNRVEQYEPTLLLIKATSGEVFGAYLSTAWIVRNEKDTRGERQRYFGTGECFLFALAPAPIKYPWVGIKGKVEHAAELFMHADSNGIAIGGGEGTGIQIDSDLRYGKTEKCLTFNNEPLVRGSSGAGDFEVGVLEVFAFSMDSQ